MALGLNAHGIMHMLKYFIAIAILSGMISAEAAEIIKLAETDDSALYSTADSVLATEAPSIRRVFILNKFDSTQRSVDQPSHNVAMIEYIVNCVTQKYDVASIALYDGMPSKHNRSKKFSSFADLPVEWRAPSPDSVGETIVSFTCMVPLHRK